MKFETDFDKQILREGMKSYFDFFNKSKISKYKTNLIIGILLLFFGTLIVYGNDNLGYFFIIVGFFSIYNSILGFRFIRKSKKELFDYVDWLDQMQQHNPQKIIVEFDDKTFNYSGFGYESKYEWELFKSCIIQEEFIIIQFKFNLITPYIFVGKSYGKSDFKLLKEFLRAKLPGVKK
jgi:hypothetical protein